MSANSLFKDAHSNITSTSTMKITKSFNNSHLGLLFNTVKAYKAYGDVWKVKVEDVYNNFDSLKIKSEKKE